MMLTGKLTFNAVAVKHIEVDKIKKTAIISLDKSSAPEGDKLDEFPDHPLQGEVVGKGQDVGDICEVGDIVLFKLSTHWSPQPYVLNDMGTIYYIYNSGDIALVRKKEDVTT
jgi:hypothetical protein